MTETLVAPVAIAAPKSETDLLAPVYPLPRLEVAAGRGARVTDADGRDYLDFVSGIAVNALGHALAGIAQRRRAPGQAAGPLLEPVRQRAGRGAGTSADRGHRLRPRVLLQLGHRRHRGGAQVRARSGARPRVAGSRHRGVPRRLPRPHGVRAVGDLDAVLPRTVRAAGSRRALRATFNDVAGLDARDRRPAWRR